MGTHNVCGYREQTEGLCEDNDPRMIAEGSRSCPSILATSSRPNDESNPPGFGVPCPVESSELYQALSGHTSDTSQQPSAYGDQTSIMKERFEMMEEMDNKIRKEMFKMIKEMDNIIMKERFKMMEEMDNKMKKERFEMMEEMDNKIRKEMFKMMEEMNNKIRKEMFENMKEMEKKIIENRTLTYPANMVADLPDNCNRAFPGRVIQIQHREKDENELLKEKNKKLEARYQELLAKMMAMHPHSENINDPLHLSAVLQSYEMLRLQQWEKVRSSMPYHWTYERGSHIIKKLFAACEKDMQQRANEILTVLDIPHRNTKMKQEIRRLFRQSYYQNFSTVCKKIVQEAAIRPETETENQFLLQCCQIYSLLLLQDPPVKAQWEINSRAHLEHVDKKDAMYWRNISLLWPIMKSGEDVIVKGVVWD